MRKNNYIINTGDNLRPEEKLKKIEENRVKYGLSKKEIDALQFPQSEYKGGNIMSLEQIFNPKNNFNTIDKLNKLNMLKKGIEEKIAYLHYKSFK